MRTGETQASSKGLGYRGRSTSKDAVNPRSTKITPAKTNSGRTHANGTREIASITTPRSVSDAPRVHCSQRDHHFSGRYIARMPHNTSAAERITQVADRRSKKIRPLTPSHTI